MSRVSLHFEDIDGEIAFRADYYGGYAAGSHAHKMAGQVIKFLEENAKTVTDRQSRTVEEEPNVQLITR